MCEGAGEGGVPVPTCLQQKEKLWETQVQRSLLYHDGERWGEGVGEEE